MALNPLELFVGVWHYRKMDVCFGCGRPVLFGWKHPPTEWDASCFYAATKVGPVEVTVWK